MEYLDSDLHMEGICHSIMSIPDILCLILTGHFRVSIDGVVPLGPSFDTVGWFAVDVEIMDKVGQVLLKDDPNIEHMINFNKIVILKEAFELADQEVNKSLQETVSSLTSLVGSNNVTYASISKEDLKAWAVQVYISLGTYTLSIRH